MVLALSRRKRLLDFGNGPLCEIGHPCLILTYLVSAERSQR